jgi:hypothetical protein
MEEVYKEQYKNCLIKIYQDEITQSPDDWGDQNVFLVAYHRDFEVRRDNILTKDVAIALKTGDYEGYEEDCEAINKKYFVFGLEAYIHSGVVLAISQEGNFCDRRWDVSQLGLVLVAKTEAKKEKDAKKLAEGLIEEWNEYLSGNVYAFRTEDETNGVDIDSCGGFYGDYDAKDADIIAEARASIDYYVKTQLKQAKKETIDKSKKTLGELLASDNETIRRHAIGILKQLN